MQKTFHLYIYTHTGHHQKKRGMDLHDDFNNMKESIKQKSCSNTLFLPGVTNILPLSACE